MRKKNYYHAAMASLPFLFATIQMTNTDGSDGMTLSSKEMYDNKIEEYPRRRNNVSLNKNVLILV